MCDTNRMAADRIAELEGVIEQGDQMAAQDLKDFEREKRVTTINSRISCWTRIKLLKDCRRNLKLRKMYLITLN